MKVGLGIAVCLLALACTTPSVVADWKLDPTYPVTPETTSLYLVVQQHDGPSGGGTPAARALAPEITYGQDAIAITVRISTPGHGIIAEGPFEFVVQLDQPVGSRQITHGSGGTDVNPTAPPIGSTPAEVLDAYLRNFQSGADCYYAGLSWAGDRSPGDGNLCGETTLIGYSINPAPATPTADHVVFATALTTTGTAGGSVAAGDVTWFFELAKQPSGEWRISGAGSGP